MAIAFGLVLLLVASIGLQSALSQREVEAKWRSSLVHADALAAAERLGWLFEQKVASSRAHLLTGDPRFATDTEAERAEFLELHARTSSTSSIPARDRLERIARSERHHHETLQRLVLAAPSIGSDRLRHDFLADLKPSRDAVDRELAALRELELAYMGAAQARADRTARDASLVSLATAALALLLGLLVTIVATRLIHRLRERERKTARELASATHERLQAEARARELEERARMFAILEAVPAGVFVLASDGRPFYANARAKQLLGREIDPDAGPGELGERYQAYVAGTDEIYPTDDMPIVRALRGETSSVSDMELAVDGRRVALQVDAHPVRAADGRIEFAVAGFVDVESLHRQAFEDPLTRLPNRASLVRAYPRMLGMCAHAERPLALAMIDLDRFKAVNDRHGHHVGDEVLRRVAALLSASVRPSDLVVRWGGEEILLLLPMSDLDAAQRQLEQLLVDVRGIAFTGHDGEPFSVTFSAGVTTVGPSESDPSVPMKRADAALYRAKAEGRARVCRKSRPRRPRSTGIASVVFARAADR